VRYVLHQVEDGSGPPITVIDLTGARVVIDESALNIEVVLRDTKVKPGPGLRPRYDSYYQPADASFNLDIVELSAASLRELAGNKSITCGAQHGIEALRVVCAAYVSHRRGHIPVRLRPCDNAVEDLWLPIT
jgi:hypothetical protein